MADKTDEKRLVDIKALLKKTRKGQTLTLSDCANIWGVTKPRFVNKRKEMDFPDHIGQEGNSHIFDKRAALNAMKAHLERHKEASTSKAKRLAKLTGAPDTMTPEAHGDLSIAELAKANQMRAQFEQEAIEQGKLVRADDVQFTVGQVFTELSEFTSDLANKVDPHGKLSPDIRKMIDKNGKDQLLSMHRRLKRFLAPDADDRGTGTKAKRTRKRPASRKSK